jgi:hypothetical protein
VEGWKHREDRWIGIRISRPKALRGPSVGSAPAQLGSQHSATHCITEEESDFG